jgi:glycosyltransferase involved in cell wall biosynthesis
MTAPSITAIVPVYRSAAILPELNRRLGDALAAITDRYEIILVEDAGGDDSWSVIERLAAADQRIRGIRMSRNYGQHNALLCGIRAARHEITVTLDDDLQNPPEEIAKLIASLGDDIDVVYGTPEQEQHGFLRDQSSRITKLALQSAMSAETARNVSAFRAFRTRIRDAFANYRGPYVSIDVLLSWATGATPRPRLTVLLGLAGGFIGVGILMAPSMHFSANESRHPGIGMLILLVASLLWSIGSLYSRSAKNADSPFLAAGQQMICGGMLLLLAGLITREKFHLAAVTAHSIWAWIYLVLIGAIIGFTAYIYLLRHCDPAKVATYAYVNPIVAVILGKRRRVVGRRASLGDGDLGVGRPEGQEHADNSQSERPRVGAE